MFIALLFIILANWKQPNYSSIGKWIHKLLEYYQQEHGASQKCHAKWKSAVLACPEALPDWAPPPLLPSRPTCTRPHAHAPGCCGSDTASTPSLPHLPGPFPSQMLFLLSLPSALCSQVSSWERPSLTVFAKCQAVCTSLLSPPYLM